MNECPDKKFDWYEELWFITVIDLKVSERGESSNKFSLNPNYTLLE